MPLVKEDLQLAFVKALKDGMDVSDNDGGKCPPMIHSKVASALASAYDSYALKATAGALIVSVPGQKAFLDVGFSFARFTGVAVAVVSYWTPIMFAGPGFIPANPVIPASPTSAITDIADLVRTKADSIESFADSFASILHTLTTQFKVTATTTSAPPVVSTLPIL